MKIFDEVEPFYGKVNFVDENNVLLGYDMASNCCEQFGWFIDDHPWEKVPDWRDEIKIPNHSATVDMPGWVFDPSYHKSVAYEGDCGGFEIFRIVNGDQEKFIHLYNLHNGYYSHGFTLKEGEAVKLEGAI
jgi:hypothetical protein